MQTADALDRYADAFERLTPDSLTEIRRLCREDVVFVDPFNDIRGVDAFVAVFEHMYDTLAEPRFEILDRAVGGDAGYIKWRMTGRGKRGSLVIDIAGMSEVAFDGAGLVARHIDHWDAASQLYARLPVVGPMIRWLGRRFATDPRR
jgi:steroid Delta-isomerase